MVAILEHMTALSDTVRCRILLMLEQHELTVSELCAVLQMPQSSVSRHLKTLADDDWVSSRRDATSRFYAMSPDDLDPGAARLWGLIREQLGSTPAAAHDARRLQGVLHGRRLKSQEFFATAAGKWDRLRSDLFGESFALWAALGLIDPTMSVGDLGCGTGQFAVTIAPYVRRVLAVDSSVDMLAAARKRVADLRNVELRRGELEAMPIQDGELDAALLSLVLHYSPDPARTLREVGRVCRPGGRVVVVDMLPHHHEEYRQQMGHVWLGFSETQMVKLLTGAGFEEVRARSLPLDPDAKGPALFVATGTRELRS